MRILWIAALVCLAACEQASEPAAQTDVGTDTLAAEAAAATDAAELAASAAPTDWIEVPLPDGTFREYADGYRTDVIEIPLEPFGELEYKLGMREGDSIVYRWEAVDLPDPELLYAEFHGHTERVGDAPGTLMFYRKAAGATESGSLVAPFTGIHGWYLMSSHDQPIVVRLQVAGFYELVEQ